MDSWYVKTWERHQNHVSTRHRRKVMDKNVIFDKHNGGHFENVTVKPCTTLQVYYRSIIVWEGPLYDINTVLALHKGG